MGIHDRISEIEDEMKKTQKNKKTEYHLGLLKARLAKLKKSLLVKKQTGVDETGFEIKKQGDSRVTLIGFPSVGKSTLMCSITDTISRAAEHEFTTLTCIGGKLKYKGACIQVLDLPGIIKGAADGVGRGKQVVSIARTSDIILMVLDPRKAHDKLILEGELYNIGIRLNKRRPEISISATCSGGVSINATVELSSVSSDMLVAVLKEFGYNNCVCVIKEDMSMDEFVDALDESIVYIRCVYCYNKIDTISYKMLTRLSSNTVYDNSQCFISSYRRWNYDELFEKIWINLNIIRVYTRTKGSDPDLNNPLILRLERSVEDICNKIHRDLKNSFKYALVWGTSAKHNPQKVGIMHQLKDEDVVQIFT